MLVDYQFSGVHTFCTPGGNFKLKPGINNFTNSDWKKIMDHEPSKKFVKSNRKIKVVSKAEDTEEKTAIQQIDKAEDIEHIVSRTHMEEMIEHWLNVENRPAIANLLRSRLKEIEAKTKPKEAV